MCRTILIVIIGSGLFVVLQSRTVVLERKLNGSSADSITSIIKGNFSVCKFEVRSLIVIIVSSGILGICKTLLQTVIGLALLAVGIGIISNILGKLSCLTIVETGETTTEVSGIIFCYPVIDEVRATIMAENCVPLSCQHEVGRTCTTNTTQLLDLLPVLYDYHETCNSVVQSTVHDLIYNICICGAEMRQCGSLVIYHYRDRTLILQILIDPLVGKFAAIGVLRCNFIRGRLSCGRLLYLLGIGSNRLCFYGLDRRRDRLTVSTAGQNAYCN